MRNSLSFQLSANSLATRLAWIVAILVVCHVAVMVVHYRVYALSSLFRDLFDLDEEQSFGTWFSAGILLLAGVVLLLYARSLKQEGTVGHRYWSFLGLGFCLLSLDEVVGLHETLNTISDIPWTLPGGAAAVMVGLLYLPFIVSLPARTRWLFLLGGAIYLGGAVGVERATDWYADEGLLSTLEYNLTTALEEAMEMLGVVIFIHALVAHIAGTSRSSVPVEIKVA